MTLAAGSTFGAYQIIEPLGRGGMATVYKAYEPALDRYVALKVLPNEFLHDPGFAGRFEREAKVIARLEHPNIIPIHNFGIEPSSRTPWMAMRFISGGTLSRLMKEGRLVPSRAITILRGVADALDYAHGKGVVHRDVKPQNILLDEAERVYLADFGIAKIVESSQGLTVTGMVTGTPQYMAPEQGMGKKVDSRADIYALGIVAYEMLTGSVPFSADTPVAVLMKHVTGSIPVPSPEEVPEVYTRALLKALAKQPEERWPSAGAFLRALEQGRAEAPTAIGLPAVEDAATAVSPAQDLQATIVSATESHTAPYSGMAAEPTLVSATAARTTPPAPSGTEPTVISPGVVPATVRAPAPPPPLPSAVPPPPPLPHTRPSPPAPALERGVSPRVVWLGLLALVVVMGLIGAAVLLWPRRAVETAEGSLVAQPTPPDASGAPTLPPPMNASSEAPATYPTGGATSGGTTPAPDRLPPTTAATAPSAFPTSPLPSATPTPAPTPTPRPPYRDAGKVEKGKDYFEKTLTFVQSGSIPFDAEVGPLRIRSIQFIAEEDNGRVNLRALFAIDCPKDSGDWNTLIRFYWLAENGDTIEDDTDRDSCSGQGVTSELRARSVPSAKAAAIRGMRIRFEATPD